MLSKGQDINGPKTQILTANFVYEMNIPKSIQRVSPFSCGEWLTKLIIRRIVYIGKEFLANGPG